jgi:hypothetical protein
MNVPTLEHRFKQFWEYNYNMVVNAHFRRLKNAFHNIGYIYQLSIYGAIQDGDKIKGVRIEILHREKLTKRMLFKIKKSLVIPPIGYNLCIFRLNKLIPIISEYEIRRRLIR